MLYTSSKECLMYRHLQKVHTCINMFSKMYFYTFISYAEMSLEVWNRLLCVYINAYLVGAYSYLQVWHLFIFSFFFVFFFSNFCIVPCLFSATKLWERYQQELRPFIWWMKNLTSMFFVFTLILGVKHFWVDLDERYVFAPTPSVGVVHIWVEYTWSWFLKVW